MKRRADGSPARAYVRATKDGQAALMYFDTGSHRSHLFHGLEGENAKQKIPNAGHMMIGCLDLPLDGWPHRAEPAHEGTPVVATLGSDFVEARATEIDLVCGRLVRRAAGAPSDDGPEWKHLPIEVVKGIMIAKVVVDGKPARLTVDTGAWNVQIIDPSLEMPNDPTLLAVVHDVFGNEVTMVRGTTLLGLGDAPVRVAHASRTRAFPAFEQQRAELGGAIDGLLGLSAFGASRIVFDIPRGEVRFVR